MVSAETKVLLKFNYDPYWVEKITGDSEQNGWEYLIRLQETLRETEDSRDKGKIRREAQEWAKSIPEAYETERKVLLERLRSATDDREKKERLLHYKRFTGRLESLTEAQIQKARESPITDLIESKRNMAKCPFHDDKTASLNLKNNYWHCHAGCGSGDTIALLMKRDGVTFKEAVLALQ